MAFPFAAVGAGLGQGTQAIMQQMQQMAQQRMQAAALQQYQQQLDAQKLAGEALMAGGIPGLGGGSGINSLPGAQMPAGPMTGAANGGIGLPGTMPVPQVPQMQPGPIGGSPLGGGPTPVAPAASAQPPGPPGEAGPRTVNLTEDDWTPETGNLMTPDQTRQVYRAAGAQEAEAGVALPPAAASAPPEQPAAAPAAPAATQDFSGGGGQAAANPNEMPLYLSMFNRVDPQAIAKRIMEIKPGADPATVMGAVEKLYKLSSGDWHQQATAASVMKALLGNQTRTDIANASRGIQQQRLGIQQQQANTAARRETTYAANLEQRKARARELTNQFNSKLADLAKTRDMNAKKVGLQALLRDVQKNLYPGLGATQPTDEEKAALQQQERAIVNELRKMSAMPALPGVAGPPAATAPIAPQ